MASSPVGADPDSYGARLRAKGVQIHAAATPTSHNRKAGDNAQFNNWEKGILMDHRPGGTQMPVLDKHGQTIGLKRAAEEFPNAQRTLAQRRHAASSKD